MSSYALTLVLSSMRNSRTSNTKLHVNKRSGSFSRDSVQTIIGADSVGRFRVVPSLKANPTLLRWCSVYFIA